MTTLFPEITMGSLRPIQDALAKQVIGDNPIDHLASKMLKIARPISAVVGLFGDWWQSIQDQLAEGVSGYGLLCELDEFLSVLENVKQVISSLQEISTSVVSEKMLLTDAAQNAQILLANATALREQVSIPVSPEFLERALKATPPTDPAEYESLDSILARLHSGGDV